MRVDDQDADVFSGLECDCVAHLLRTLIWILRQEQDPLFSRIARPGHVRVVDARIGAYKAELVFNDDGAHTGPQDFIAFLQDQLDNPRVLFGLVGDLDGARCG
jgi:hypothetical protein